MADGNVFRPAALERMASPEQLDQLTKIADAKGWLGLAACGVLIFSALTWGVLGSVATKEQAGGILIYSAGLADVVTVAAGQITSLDVDVGDEVHVGQVVAHLAQPALQAELAGLQAQHKELVRASEKSSQLQRQDVQLRASASAQARAALLSSLSATEQRERDLSERLGAQQRLYEHGLITKETLLSTQEGLRTAQASLKTMQTDLQQVELTRLTADRSNEVERRQHEARIQDSALQIQLLEQRLAQNSRVSSAYEGRIVELRAMLGDVIDPGQPIVSMERSERAGVLEALLYLDSRQGKRIKPGMAVELSPSMARRERFGVLRAEVIGVDAFPSTRRGMVRVLHNEQLVDTFLTETQGVAFAVRARLITDASAAGGYAWSSQRGAAVKLSSGTRCAAAIITGRQAPLSLLFPTLEAVL